MEATKFILFSNVKIVSGKKNVIVIDLQRECVYKVPNSLLEFVCTCFRKTKSEIFNLYLKQTGLVEDYLDFLLENDLGMFVEDVDLFPEINEYWNAPYDITNGILDINKQIDLKLLCKSFDNIKIPYLNLRVFELQDWDYMVELFIFMDKYIYIGYTVYIPYCELYYESLVKLILNSKKCYFILFYNGPSILRAEPTYSNKDILITTENITSHLCCGEIRNYFNPNMKSYFEALASNTCLNRKISIDVDGNIKNCPSLPESFGNIKDTTLKEAIEKPGFKSYWNINKDKIHVCKDCEYRYICTDCRAYIEDPEDILSKPLKCGYNPYTGEWSEWSTNPLKQKAIQYYGMEELVAERQERLKADAEQDKQD